MLSTSPSEGESTSGPVDTEIVAAVITMTIDKRITSGADDVEQRNKKMSLNSSDLQLVVDGPTNQLVGLRFTALDIPAGAVITAAYIQFQTDETSTGAASLLIRGLDSDDASPFTSGNNNLSSRQTTSASSSWLPQAWTIIDEAGTAQRTPDLTAIVQEIIDRAGWQAGNDIAFVISGTGTRTADAYEDGAAKAPLLHIEYTVPATNAAPVIDLDASGAGLGYAAIFSENGAAVPIADSDALVTDSDDTVMERLTVTITNAKGGDQLLVSGTLPAGISIDPASTATNLIITGSASIATYQAALQQLRFSATGTPIDPSAREVQVTIFDGQASSSPAVATITINPANIAPVVDLDGSSAGLGYSTAFSAGGSAVPIADSDTLITDADDSSMASLTVLISNAKAGDQLLVSGTLPTGIAIGSGSTATNLILTGLASKAAYEQALEQVRFSNSNANPDPTPRQVQVTVNDGEASSSPATATVAIATGTGVTTIEKRIAAGADDVEQLTSNGNMLLTSSDIDLVVDGSAGQLVGLRFTALNIPPGAIITAAYIQFQTDETGSGAASLLIRAVNSDDASPFTNSYFDLSSRPATSVSVSWQPQAWTVVGQAGAAQRTPDLSVLVQAIVDRAGWQSGNDLAFMISGSGTRTAEAYESGATSAPLLHIEYTLSAINVPPVLDLDGSASGSGYAAVFSTSGGAVPIADSDTLITDADDSSMASLTVAISNAKAGDQLLVSGTLPTGIAIGSSSTATNLILTGSASKAAYEQALEQVRFNNSNASPDPATRQIQVTVNDGEATSSPAVASIGISTGSGAPDIFFDLNQDFRENIAGATAGTLSVFNAEPGQSYTFSVADSRFEIVGNILKLKEGVRLDFERVPSISLDITATASGGGSFIDGVTAPVVDVQEIRFAAFGDYGNNAGAAAVAQLVNSLAVDFIITTGDNMYGSTPIDDQVGNKYSSYIGNYQGDYGSGSAINRFWPSIGNHEYSGEGGGVPAYKSYFTLPGNELYYDFVIGPVHFFAIDSNSQQPDGRSATSIQAQWLQSELAASTSPFNIVYFHHPPFSSGTDHGSTTTMRWPFEAWGATAVLSGHEHVYERVHRDDNQDGTILPYFTTGLGGASRYSFGTPIAGSQARFADDWGAMLIQASAESITFEFIAITGGGQGTLIDSYTIDLLAPAAPAAVGGERGLFTFDEPERYTPHFEPDFGASPFRMGPDPLSAFDLV